MRLSFVYDPEGFLFAVSSMITINLRKLSVKFKYSECDSWSVDKYNLYKNLLNKTVLCSANIVFDSSYGFKSCSFLLDF